MSYSQLTAVFLLALGTLAAACGGRAVAGGSGGSGGSTVDGGNSSSDSGTDGGWTCSDYIDCCAKTCDWMIGPTVCPNSVNPDCPCMVPPDQSSACTAATIGLDRCVLGMFGAGKSVLSCDQFGQTVLRCGVCAAAVKAVTQACGGTPTCAN